MGIRGLNSFVDQNFTGWEHKRVEGRLVLDGYSVMHQIHETSRISWYHGGQYGQFRVATIAFIDRLVSNGISPVFVFDGIDYTQEKAKVLLKRRTESVQSICDTFAGRKCADFRRVLPLLSMEVFRDALEEREIPFYYVDGEGDPDTVALANHYHCPVVSSDSDFYMFNIKEGYIPMGRLYLNLKQIEADFYYRSNFIKYFKLAPELCLVIPAIAGNDFIHVMSHRALKDAMISGRQAGTVELLVRFLANFKSLDHLLEHISGLYDGARCRGHLENNYRRANEFYSITHIVSEDTLMSNTVLGFFDGTRLPMWVLRQYRHGYFVSSLIQPLVLRKCLLRIVPDDPQRETAHACSRPIRQAIYGILEQPKSSDGLFVEETVREKSQLVGEFVERVFLVKDLQLPSIHSTESMTPAERRSILYAILGCDVDHLERKWQLVAAASFFWVKVTRPLLKHIQALILTFLHCSAGQYSPQSSRRHEERKSPQWMKAFHCYAQWQCVYLDAFKLNNTLMNPLLYESPAFLFDGEMVMHYVLRRDLNYIIRKEVDELRKRDLYDRLMSTISASLPAQQEKKPSQSTNPTPKPVPKPKHGASSGVAVANRFALLTVEESESSDSDD